MIEALLLPEHPTPEILHILGLPPEKTASMAAAYRRGGHDVPTDPAGEQAFVIWRFLRFAIEHGLRWSSVAADEVRQMAAEGAERVLFQCASCGWGLHHRKDQPVPHCPACGLKPVRPALRQ